MAKATINADFAYWEKNKEIVNIKLASTAAIIRDIMRKFLYSFPTKGLFLCSIGANFSMNSSDTVPTAIENHAACSKGKTYTNAIDEP